ncbi:MAG TPA: hypothetical protein VH306_03750 [Gaiellaceae bacterium]|jgi:membrane protein YdbS with pleckstrin-like domain
MSFGLKTECSAVCQNSRWAPWWLYVIVIFPISWNVQQWVAGDAPWWYHLALAVGVIVANVAIITAIHRAYWDRRGES